MHYDRKESVQLSNKMASQLKELLGDQLTNTLAASTFLPQCSVAMVCDWTQQNRHVPAEIFCVDSQQHERRKLHLEAISCSRGILGYEV